MKRAGILIAMLWLGSAALSVATAQPYRFDLNAQLRRARVAWRSGANILEAKARVDRVVKLEPDNGDALKLRAQILMEMKRPGEALTDARRAVLLRPDDPEAHLLLCEASRLNGDIDQAKKSLDDAAARVLDDAAFHLRLSWNALLLHEYRKAEAFARIALQQDPNESEAYYQLARVFVEQDRPDDAAVTLTRGFEKAVVDPEIIRSDSLLVKVAHHRALDEFMKR